MIPKDKAKDLASKFAQLDYGFNDKIEISEMHKRQALLAVSEIQIYLMDIMLPNIFDQYLNEVRTEIKKL